MPPDGSETPIEPRARLEALFVTYPLGEFWRRPEVFLEDVVIEGVQIRLTGLCASSVDGRDITGSAASSESSPEDRAYFELVERVSIAEAVARPRSSYAVFDAHGHKIEECDHGTVFPINPPGASFRYALSNGVAVGSSFASAARAAFHELVERDRILRSWYGEVGPVRVLAPRLGSLASLDSVYRLETFRFPSSIRRNDALDVVAVFGFPRRAGAPLIRGMGAGTTLEEAEARAARECLQNLGFLWGESIPESKPKFSAAAEYHQEYYLWPNSQVHLDRWLAGEHIGRTSILIQRSPRQSPPKFADLTPPHLFGRLYVLKALPEGELPVVFGEGHPNVPDAAASDLEVHPVS